MRIISGIYKNKEIKMRKQLSETVRPTLVRVRTIIFDILSHYYYEEEFSFLDVFTGAGAMGLEALSRNNFVVFWDIDKKVIQNLEHNLKNMPKLTKYRILNVNALKPPQGSPMQVVYLDPPYDSHNIICGVIKRLQKYNWIDTNSLIIVEHAKKIKIKYPETLFLWREKIVGNTCISCLKYIDNVVIS